MRRNALRWLMCLALVVTAISCEDDPEEGGDDAATDMSSDTSVDTSTGDTSTGDTSTEDTSTGDTGDTGDTTTGDTSGGDTLVDSAEVDAGPECVESVDCTGELGVCVDNVCVECSSDADCATDTPLCDDTNTCVQDICVPDLLGFDCSSPDRPACVDGDTALCGTYDLCTDDDVNEPDDGPSAATDITPTEGDTNSITANICNAPGNFLERDWFVFSSGAGDHWTITLDFSTDDDLNLDVYDSNGEVLGYSWYGANGREQVELTFLPEGDYYISVHRSTVDGDGNPVETLAAVEYTVEVDRLTGNACTSTEDCAVFYETQIFRGSCNGDSGACEFIDGAGALAEGDTCDSSDDCSSGLCTYGATGDFSGGDDVVWASFMANANTRAFCTVSCTDDAGCGEGQICTTAYDSANHCVTPCTTNAECPVLMGTEPRRTDDFFNLTCLPDTGCAVVQPIIVGTDQILGTNGTGDPTATIDSVTSDGPGIITIHEGAVTISTVIGWIAVPSGPSEDVVVTLDSAPAPGTRLFGLLRSDRGVVGDFETSLDQPVTNAAGFPIQTFFDVLEPPSNSLTVTSPSDLELTTLLILDSISAEEDGFVVVHADNSGSPGGTILAVVPIATGNYTNFEVGFDAPLADGTVVHPMLHVDSTTAGTFGTYDDASTDPPAQDDASATVVQAVTVNVAEGTPDAEIAVTATSTVNFEFTGVRPANASWSAGVIGAGTGDQTLALFSGWRYLVTNAASGSHPFEIITGDVSTTNTAGDTVQLSQRDDLEGAFETDLDVNWVETTESVTFTLDIGLEAGACADPGADCLGYRCGVHTSSMRGHITVSAP